MGPLRSGILEMITVSVGPGACALFSALLCAAALCANASGAEQTTSERASRAKPASATARVEDLAMAWITTAPSDCNPRPPEKCGPSQAIWTVLKIKPAREQSQGVGAHPRARECSRHGAKKPKRGCLRQFRVEIPRRAAGLLAVGLWTYAAQLRFRDVSKGFFWRSLINSCHLSRWRHAMPFPTASSSCSAPRSKQN